tara:strand:+ start:505 stop:816 length:312 start_codon:yes stop_codon:yes gene_type:complete
MIYDHEAIRRVNSNITRIVDGGEISDASGAIYTYGKEITQEQVDQARREINAELAATKYQRDREAAYPSIADQLDMQYWDKKNGTTTWVDAIAKVKTDYPKPS